MGNEVTYALDAMQGIADVRSGKRQLAIVSAGKSIKAYEFAAEIASEDPALLVQLGCIVCEDGNLHEHAFVAADTYPNVAREALEMIFDAVQESPTVTRVQLQARLGGWLGYGAQDILDFINSDIGRTCVCDCCGGAESVQRVAHDATDRNTRRFERYAS